mgnify:CR=1 FL=1
MNMEMDMEDRMEDSKAGALADEIRGKKGGPDEALCLKMGMALCKMHDAEKVAGVVGRMFRKPKGEGKGKGKGKEDGKGGGKITIEKKVMDLSDAHMADMGSY